MDIFFKTEELKGQNKYKCSGCKKAVDATKKYTIHERPVVLTIHLKRFDNNFMRINKISKHIKFNESINLAPYMAEKGQKSLMYDLHTIVIHMGAFTSSGHYYSYIKNSNGIWHLMNDEDVRTTKIDNVLGQSAYLLVYVLKDAPNKKDAIATAVANAATTMNGVHKPLINGEAELEKLSKEAMSKATTPKAKASQAKKGKMVSEEEEEEEEKKERSKTPTAKAEPVKTASDKIFEKLSRLPSKTEQPALNNHVLFNQKKSDGTPKANGLPQRVPEPLFKENGFLAKTPEFTKKDKPISVIDQIFKKYIPDNKPTEKQEEKKGKKENKAKNPMNIESDSPEPELPQVELRHSYSKNLESLLDQRELTNIEENIVKQPQKSKLPDNLLLRRSSSDTKAIKAFSIASLRRSSSVISTSSTGLPKLSLTLPPPPLLRTSSLQKLRRVAKLITAFNIKKRKLDDKGNAAIVAKIEKVPEVVKKQEVAKKPEVISKPDVFVSGREAQRALASGRKSNIDVWDRDADDLVPEMLEERRKIMKENDSFFVTPKKEKDEYDIEYDRGKQKKIKKKKEKQTNDFQKTYEFIARGGFGGGKKKF
jgi:ubiquitin carboxyl-terminal hydrolase 36/42